MVRRIASFLGDWLLLLLFAAVMLLLFVLPSLEVAYETYELLLMRSTTMAQVRAIHTEIGDGGTGRPIIDYEYVWDGQVYRSTRYLPGYLPQHFQWTGGDLIASNYFVGQEIEIHLSNRNPVRSVIEYGWSKMALGFLFLPWGIVFRGGRRLIVRTIGTAFVLFGFGLFFIAPHAVRPSELHFYTLLGAGLSIVAWLAESKRRTDVVDELSAPECESTQELPKG